MIVNSHFNCVNHILDWLASSVVSRTNQHLGYLMDVILAASGKIRDNVEALGAEQVDSSVLCVDHVVLIKFLKRLCQTMSVLCQTMSVKLISMLFAKVQLLMNAADYYVVPGLKRLCEQWLVETLNTTNMVDRFSF